MMNGEHPDLRSSKSFGVADHPRATRPRQRKADGRPPSRYRINASGDASDSTIPSPCAGSLEMAAASNVPAAPPALLPKGDSAAALDSGLAMPNPNRKIAVAARKGGNASGANSAAPSSAI